MEAQPPIAPELNPDRPDWALTPDQLKARHLLLQPRSLLKLWRMLEIGLWAYAGYGVLQIISTVLQLNFVPTTEDMQTRDFRTLQITAVLVILVALALLALVLTVNILFLRFMWRSADNVRRNGGPLDMSPNLITFSAILPVLGYFVPYVGMRKVWRASMHPASASAEPPTLMHVWWGLWTLANLLGFRFTWNNQVVFGAVMLADSPGAKIALSVLVSGLQVGAMLAVIPVFRRLAEAQEAFIRARPAETQSPAA